MRRKRTTYSLLSLFVLLLVLFATTGIASATTFSTPVDADYGHIANSVDVSRDDFPDGAPAAVLTGSESYTDSLTATVLAKAANGPLLLTSSTSLSASVRDELVRLKVTKVFVVGLSTTIVNAVKTALPTLAPGQIVVLAGSDRYQTAALVAGKVKELTGGTPPARAFIVPGDVYGSSLAAAAVAAANGWPILLTPQGGPFPSSSAQAIVSLGVKTGVRVDTSVDPGVSGFTVEKTIMGTTSATDDPGARYTEALAMAEYAVQQGWATYSHLALGEEQGGSVAYSANFPDNVLLASHIAREGGAYLLSRSTALHSTVVNLLKQHGKDMDSIDFMRPDYDQVLSGAWSFGTIRQVKGLNSPRVTGLSKTSGSLAGGGALTVTGSGFTGATTVRIGKTDLPAGSWRANSDTSITIDAVPAATGQGAAEILVSNYWNANPSGPSDVYLYLPDSGPELAAMKVVREAVKYLGVPYVWAGASTSGFDCSGFTMYVYNKFTTTTGVTLPHKSTYQANYGAPVDKDDLLPGDLVFFNSPISHVGMYVGNGLMINSPRSGDLVTIEDVYRSGYATARRFISAYTRVEQTNSLLAYTGAWSTGSTSLASGGSYRYSNSTGFSVTVTFNGVYLQWIAAKSSLYGQASVWVDGKTLQTVDLYSASAAYKQKVWDTGILPSGTHTVKITRTGNKNAAATAANVSVDAFDVVGTVVKAQTVPTPTRSEQTDTHLAFTGTWGTGLNTGASGGSWGYTNTSGSAVTVKFTGTSLSWIAVKSPNYGIAQVTLDGGSPVNVDLYSADTKWQQPVWSATGLADSAHTVTIAYTGDKNAAAAAAYIGVDAFDVEGTFGSALPAITSLSPSSGSTAGGTSVTINGSGFTNVSAVTFGDTGASSYTVNSASNITAVAPAHAEGSVRVQVTTAGGPTEDTVRDDYTYAIGPTRYDQTNPNITKTGTWEDFASTAAYLGSYGRSSTGGAKATIYFTGTKIAWIGMKGLTPGIVDVYLDDVNKATLNLYASPAKYQVTLWTSDTLANGTHHLDLVRNSASLSTEFIVLDAVDIWGDIKAGP